MLETRRNFLDVTQSVLGRAWIDRLDASGARMAGERTQRLRTIRDMLLDEI